MRIVEVAEFYSPTGGGVRSYIDRKFEIAADQGHELFVLAPAAEDGFEARPGGALVRVRAPQLPMDANYRMFWHAAPVHQWLDRLAPDLVEASSPWRGAWIAASWRGRARRAMFVHSDPVASYPHRWLGPLIGRNAVDGLFAGFWAYLQRLTAQFDSVVVGGDWLARRLTRHGVRRVESVPMGVDRRVFSPALRDERLRAQLLEACGLPPDARLVLGVGRFHAEKRWPMVIAAVSRARTETPLGVVVIGDGIDRARVRRAAAAQRHAHVLGPIFDRPRLAAVLASGDALAHGCESETFGLIPAEAMASGLPLVAPDLGGCAHLANPAASELYRAGDVASATAAVERIFARDPHVLRAAALQVAAKARSDADHFVELFGHYERLTHLGPHVRPAAEPRAAAVGLEDASVEGAV